MSVAAIDSGVCSFASDVLNVQLYPRQAETLAEIERSGASETVLCLGRRSGKDLMTGTMTLHHAVCVDLHEYLRPGEPRLALIVATSLEQARQTLATCSQLIAHSNGLQRLVVSESLDEIVLATGVIIRAVPCNARSIRGPACSFLAMNQVAHFVSATDGYQTAERIHAALSPALAQFGDEGRIVYLSTPLWPSGLFHKKFVAAMAGTPGMIGFQASTAEMNPRISRAWLERQRVADPELFVVEYEAVFSSAVSAYLDAEAVSLCITPDVRERPPRLGAQYVMAIDPAYVNDRFAAMIVGRLDGRLSVDLCRQWRGSRAAPVDHALVLAEIADLARQYRATVTTDQYASAPVKQGLAKLGIHARYEPWTNDSKRLAFGSLKAAVNTGMIDLLDLPDLRLELLSLEVRATLGGRPRIAARPPVHDDLACCLAAAAHQLSRRHFGPPVAPVGVGKTECWMRLGAWSPPGSVGDRVAAAESDDYEW